MTADRLVTPCESSACIALTPYADGRLALTTTAGMGSTVVTVDEVRKFAAAVQSGFFDELLGGGGLD